MGKHKGTTAGLGISVLWEVNEWRGRCGRWQPWGERGEDEINVTGSVDKVDNYVGGGWRR